MGCQQSTEAAAAATAPPITHDTNTKSNTTTTTTINKETSKPTSNRNVTGKHSVQTRKGDKRIAGIGQSERLMSAQMRRLHNSNSSHKGTITMEEDEQLSIPPKLNASGNLMPEEIVRRTTSSLTTSRYKIGSSNDHIIQTQFAHWKQRGYYPDDPCKANQDELSITLNMAGEEGDAMFAVFDGHGTDGHACARFAKTRLPQIVAKYVRQRRVQNYQAELKAAGKPTKGSWNPASWPLLNVEDYEACCRKSYLEVNKAMHDDVNIPDKLSGTTATSVNFHAGRMTVCNVGDSRVVVGHRLRTSGNDQAEEAKEEETVDQIPATSYLKGRLIALPLTRDQTPYRQDERERVRKHGAEIKSIDQMEGREPMHDNWGDMVLGKEVDIHGDPPRVWVKGEEYPGTAFTRSLGDSVAEEIGVNAEPEIVTTQLTSHDEYLVIASDGIFEFLTNQQVIDMCDQCENPLQACELLVKAAYDKWLLYERRTDDITAIVVFLNSKHEPEDIAGTTHELATCESTVYGNTQLMSMLGRGESIPKLNVGITTKLEAAVES